MSAETKRREILQMLAQGAISAQEAGQLLEQVQAEEHASRPPAEVAETAGPAVEPGKPARWLNVQVKDAVGGRNKVSVKIPLSLARMGLRMGAKFAPEIDDMDWDEVLSQLSAGGGQTLVEVMDEEDGEFVRVFVS